MIRALVAAGMLVLVAATGTPGRLVAPGSRPSPQAQQIVAVKNAEAQIAGVATRPGAEVGVYWRALDSNNWPESAREINFNSTTRFHAASTMKVPIMIELFKQAAAGRLMLEDLIPVTNQFTSIVDGSPYVLSATEDSDGEVYKAIGQRRSYRDLCEAMITVSSNLAANILIDRLSAKSIQATVEALGAGGMQVLRGVEDQKAFDKGMNNTTDAVGLGTLLWKIGRGEVVDSKASATMVEMLARQQFNEGIPAGVPKGTKVAHKTGSITRVRHDAGIVYAPNPYVLVVLTRGIEDPKVADALIAEISRIVYPLGQKLP
jgi:beta-lactamase class A